MLDTRKLRWFDHFIVLHTEMDGSDDGGRLVAASINYSDCLL